MQDGSNEAGVACGMGSNPSVMGVRDVIGLLSDGLAVQGSASLDVQRAAIDAAAGTSGVVVTTYFMEMSRPVPGDLWPPAVRDILRLARAGSLAVLLLDRVDNLSHDRDAALLVAVLLGEFGVDIIETRRGASTVGAISGPATRRGGARRRIAHVPSVGATS